MRRFTVGIVGLGERGRIHLHGLLRCSEYFQVIGVCDRHPENQRKVRQEFSLPGEAFYSDAEKMMRDCRPDVLVFATMPHIRKELVELAVKYEVKGLMMEKPLATSLKEASHIRDLCREKGIKTVVCQQHKYLSSFLELKRVLESGELGEIVEIKASCYPNASNLGVHYIDYIMWANRYCRVKCVVGHIHGDFFLSDSHPSPDYVMGQILFQNSVRGIIECGYLSAHTYQGLQEFSHTVEDIRYWTDDCLTVYGTQGYSYAKCNGEFGVFSSQTQSELIVKNCGDFEIKEQYDAQVRYTKDFAEWLRDDKKIHNCNIENAYNGYEILEGIYRSALECTRIDLPIILSGEYDVLEHCKLKLRREKFL